MLQDREYLKGLGKQSEFSNFFRNMSAVKLLILANVAVYFIEAIFVSFFRSDWFSAAFGLSVSGVAQFYIWTFASYAFLHGSLWHILLNMVALFFVGPQLERRIGFLRFMTVYAVSALLGGFIWFGIEILSGGESVLVGASAGVVGILATFCMLEADKKMTFLLFFILPVTMRPRVMLAFLAGFELFNFLFNELSPGEKTVSVGYSAHLGGMAAGIVAALIIDGKIPFINFRKKRKFGSASDYSFRVNMISDDELKTETNRILDKINEKGYYSLTQKEKEILNIAKDRLK